MGEEVGDDLLDLAINSRLTDDKKTGASAFRYPSAVTEFNSVSKLTHYW